MVDLREPSGTLHRQQRDLAVTLRNGYPATPDSDLSVLVAEPRLLTENDIPWLYDICTRRYSRKYDPISTELWFRNKVLKEPLMFLPQRTREAFCISTLSVLPWLPTEFNCNVAFIAAEEGAVWEAVKLLRASMAWSYSRKCVSWGVASDTGVDLKPLAKLLGADEIYPRYAIRFSYE